MQINKGVQKIKISPSGKYKVIVTAENDEKWKIRAQVYRMSDNHMIADIYRHFIKFNSSFFIKDGKEWLQTGRHYMTQLFIDLDNGTIYDDIPHIENSDEYYTGKSFCWKKSWASPDGKTLAVAGYYWASDNEIKFYDITDISKGWPELKINDYFLYNNLKYPKWKIIDNDICIDVYDQWITLIYHSIGNKLIHVKDLYEFSKNKNSLRELIIVTLFTGYRRLKRNDNQMQLLSETEILECAHFKDDLRGCLACEIAKDDYSNGNLE